MKLLGHLSLQCVQVVCLEFCEHVSNLLLRSGCVLILFPFFPCRLRAGKNLQTSTDPYSSLPYRDQSLDYRIMRDKLKILFDGYRKMIDHSFSKSKDLGDMLRILPGVVVQRNLSMQGMVDLYSITLDFLERFIKSFELLIPSPGGLCLCYRLDDDLSVFLQDRDRSQLYYCDPELQHISICRQILSSLDRSNVSELQS